MTERWQYSASIHQMKPEWNQSNSSENIMALISIQFSPDTCFCSQAFYQPIYKQIFNYPTFSQSHYNNFRDLQYLKQHFDRNCTFFVWFDEDGVPLRDPAGIRAPKLWILWIRLHCSVATFAHKCPAQIIA